MTARAKLRGYPIEWDGSKWIYSDNGNPTATTWRSRPCGECGQYPTVEGHDACIANLPGVKNACCGHGGSSKAYIQLEDGWRL